MATDAEWNEVKRSLFIGTAIRCRVREHHPFGVYATIVGIPFDGLIQITDFKDVGRMTPSQYPPVNTEVDAVVLGFKESGKQIWLGMRPSQQAAFVRR